MNFAGIGSLPRLFGAERYRLTRTYNRLFGQQLGWPVMRARFLVLITNRVCNLHCRDCGTLTPYLPKSALPAYFAPEQLYADLRRLRRVLRVGTLQLQGGESLLHPEIDRIVDLAARCRIASRIELVTNATRSLSPKVIAALRATRASVRVSDYGLGEQQVIDEISAVCAREGIRCFRHKMATRSYRWLLMGDPWTERVVDDAAVQKVFETCPYQVCWTLTDGLFSKCSRAPAVHLTGADAFSVDDFVDLRHAPSATTLRRRLSRYLFHTSFMEACRTCRGATGAEVPAGVQLPRAAVSKLLGTTRLGDRAALARELAQASLRHPGAAPRVARQRGD